MKISREIAVPLVLIAAVACMVLPLPPSVLDLLLPLNLLLGVLLFVGALSIKEPLELSALPGIILLATLFRLSLNLATTRAILTHGNAGQVVQAFGQVVMQSNIALGLVLFLLITVVQFIVVAKGAERVAEVAARFTLDALPGKQMAIDADVRAGILDAEGARAKRQDIQAESRFYGALDGAMKFVKGDAIAGLLITAVNIIGGFATGLLGEGLPLSEALHRYTMLSIGDGLLAQIPSLLNAVAAGLVVTRVVHERGASLSGDLFREMGQLRQARAIVAWASFALAFAPGLPMWSLLSISAVLAGSFLVKVRPKAERAEKGKAPYMPSLVPVIGVEYTESFLSGMSDLGLVTENADCFRRKVFEDLGLVLPRPEMQRVEGEFSYQIAIRGVSVSRRTGGVSELFEDLAQIVRERAPEFVDDVMTRRALDYLELEAPELVANTVPSVVSVTQVTGVMRSLIAEGVSVRNLDLIVQSIAEHASRLTDRQLLPEVRIALRRIISERFSDNGDIEGYVIDPLLDIALVRAEEQGQLLSPEIHESIDRFLEEHEDEQLILFASKKARMYLNDYIRVRQSSVTVLAHEEICKEVNVRCLGYLEPGSHEKVVHSLAA